MGFLDDLLGGGSGKSAGYQKKLDQQASRTNGLARILLDSYNQRAQAGAYDPNQRLDLLKKDNEYSTKIATGNAAAAARNLGYRPGDSEPMLAQRAIGERATLDYGRMADDIRSSSMREGAADLANTVGGAGSLFGQSAGIYQTGLQSALQQEQQQGGLFGTLLGAAMPFLGPAGVGAGALMGTSGKRGINKPTKTNPFYT